MNKRGSFTSQLYFAVRNGRNTNKGIVLKQQTVTRIQTPSMSNSLLRPCGMKTCYSIVQTMPLSLYERKVNVIDASSRI